MAKEFEIKDLGSLKYFLGIEVARSKQGIFISQRKYVLDLLQETGMLEVNQKLGDDTDGAVVDKGRYQRLVGKLIYLSHTRPDIAFAVSVVSQFMHAPRECHYDAVLRILRYLKLAPGKGLFFGTHNHLQVEGTQMQIGQVQLQTEDLPLGIVPLLEEILLHSVARNSLLYQDLEPRQNFGLCLREFLSYCG